MKNHVTQFQHFRKLHIIIIIESESATELPRNIYFADNLVSL